MFAYLESTFAPEILRSQPHRTRIHSHIAHIHKCLLFIFASSEHSERVRTSFADQIVHRQLCGSSENFVASKIRYLPEKANGSQARGKPKNKKLFNFLFVPVFCARNSMNIHNAYSQMYAGCGYVMRIYPGYARIKYGMHLVCIHLHSLVAVLRFRQKFSVGWRNWTHCDANCSIVVFRGKKWTLEAKACTRAGD